MADDSWRAATESYKDLQLTGMSWEDFVAAIKRADSAWRSIKNKAVLGDGVSWERTIRTGHDVVTMPNWDRLQPLQADVLIGSGHRDPAYMFLGNNFAAGFANHMLRGEECVEQRRAIHKLLLSLANTPVSEFPRAAEQVMASLLAMERIGKGVATRLIALARPDCGISVNGASKERLGDVSGVPKHTLNRPEQYRALLEWLIEQPWHRAGKPSDPAEQNIWDIRAALFDSLVYDPIVRENEDESSEEKNGPVLIRRARASAAPPTIDPTSEMAALLKLTAQEVAAYLQKVLPAIGGASWWKGCVLDCLTPDQRNGFQQLGVDRLGGLDLVALLRVFDQNWYRISSSSDLRREARTYLKEMMLVRNQWKHESADGVKPRDAYRDADTLHRFLSSIGADASLLHRADELRRVLVRSF